MGEIITFYSYKGGVGRSMALANIAVLLARQQYKVLVVDWDLEAPGLEYFFKDFIPLKKVMESQGIIDILHNVKADGTIDQSLHWAELCLPVYVSENSAPIHFLGSGKRDEEYFNKVRNLDINTFYNEQKGGFFIESLRSEWKQAYDFILIDSRTGITDIGGICTIQLPDILVLLFTATEQSLKGVIDVGKKANVARQKLPVDRYTLLCLPVPCRFDSADEFIISQEWLDRFEQELFCFYDYWLPDSIKRREFIEKTKIPYTAYFSFGEKLPVVEQGTTDPHSIGYAYETLSFLLVEKLALDSIEQLITRRYARDTPWSELSQKRHLVKLILECPSMKDKMSRSAILKQLPDQLANAVQASDNAEIHVLNIVDACLDYPDGLKLLLDAIDFFDGETKQFQTLIAFADKVTNAYKVDNHNKAQPDNIIEGTLVTTMGPDIVSGNKLTHISSISPKEYLALSKELGVRQIALENFFEILDKGAVPLKDLDRELREVAEKHKEFLSRNFEQVMEQSKLTPQIKAKDEFTHHSKQSRELIKKAQRKLKYLPSHPEYLKVMLMGGTVLSSAGKLKEAKELLLKALDISDTEEDRGLIRFNLFQTCLRCRDYGKALDNLREAIKINPERYALHDVKKYPIECLLGAGGMGCVFLCFYPLKKKKVVVKCLWEKRADADREAAIMQEAAGKYVSEIIDYDYSGSKRAYFVSEYIEGAIDGAAWLKKHGKLGLKESLEVGLQIAEALQSAHEKGIYHLGLKPANILLKPTAAGIAVKVIDFGLSKAANLLQREAISRQQTQLGLSVFGQRIMGTLEYAPPEQLGYSPEYGEPDAKSDVFSFGVTLYHLLTGERPRFLVPRNLPDLRELQDLLFDCVDFVPEKRPNMEEIKGRLCNLIESDHEFGFWTKIYNLFANK